MHTHSFSACLKIVAHYEFGTVGFFNSKSRTNYHYTEDQLSFCMAFKTQHYSFSYEVIQFFSSKDQYTLHIL